MNQYEVTRRVIDNAPDETTRKWLLNDLHYGSPASFWSSALSAGLITQEEYDQAEASYIRSGLWHYRGD